MADPGFPRRGGDVILQKKELHEITPHPLDHPIVIIFSEDFQYKHITAEESKFHNKFICARFMAWCRQTLDTISTTKLFGVRFKSTKKKPE